MVYFDIFVHFALYFNFYLIYLYYFTNYFFLYMPILHYFSGLFLNFSVILFTNSGKQILLIFSLFFEFSFIIHISNSRKKRTLKIQSSFKIRQILFFTPIYPWFIPPLYSQIYDKR